MDLDLTYIKSFGTVFVELKEGHLAIENRATWVDIDKEWPLSFCVIPVLTNCFHFSSNLFQRQIICSDFI